MGHRVLPVAGGRAAEAEVGGSTPGGTAGRLLAMIDPSTSVRVDPTTRVAGRPAYTLVLSPRGEGSTVREVRIAVDAVQHVPLQVQVWAVGGRSPAVQVGFTRVSFTRPAASVFRFHPPAGAVVSGQLLPGPRGPRSKGMPAPMEGTVTAPRAEPRLLGEGWTAVLELLPSTDGFPPFAAMGAGAGMVERLMQSRADGSRVLQTALVNALVTPDGRTFVGAVRMDLLEKAAAGQRG